MRFDFYRSLALTAIFSHDLATAVKLNSVEAVLGNAGSLADMILENDGDIASMLSQIKGEETRSYGGFKDVVDVAPRPRVAQEPTVINLASLGSRETQRPKTKINKRDRVFSKSPKPGDAGFKKPRDPSPIRHPNTSRSPVKRHHANKQQIHDFRQKDFR